jgi:hypothetical protein
VYRSNVSIWQCQTERNVSLSVNGELDNDHYNALLPVSEKERLSTFEEELG